MSIHLIDLNDDLRRLRDEAYDVSIINNYLIIKNIPYVNKKRQIHCGIIFCALALVAGTKTENPIADHTVFFTGERPCDQFGNENQAYIHSPNNNIQVTPEIISNFYFSSKPTDGYKDYYHKMTRYIELLSAPAKSIDPNVSAQNPAYMQYYEVTESIFAYPDTSTSRAGIVNISNKLLNLSIAIVGLGGTGSYVLDFISKTPVKQITLFDGDELQNHNAYRCPGVVSIEDLRERPSKALYYKEKYGKFRNGIAAHNIYIDSTNVSLLSGNDFVFLNIDSPESKKIIIDFLVTRKIPFVDLGMNISMVNQSLRGILRKTLITPENNEFIKRISVEHDNNDVAIYSQNIQIAELNALNAILGVIAWKKYIGFYLSAEPVSNTTYIIDEEEQVNET